MSTMALDADRRSGRRHWVRHLLVEALMLGCLAILVACVFALVLFGLGRAPSGREAALVASAAIAAVLSAVLWVPTRGRLSPAVTRLVHGQRGPPEQALRAFETRLSRALPLDELLLGLAETLRRTLALSVAEVWIATDALLERAASDPARPPATLVLTDGERSVLARSGAAGAAWAAVWLPVLVAGREQAELRLAPIVNAGELLGLVVAQREVGGEPFDDDEERVLTELSRRVGLTFRNLRLDSASRRRSTSCSGRRPSFARRELGSLLRQTRSDGASSGTSTTGRSSSSSRWR